MDHRGRPVGRWLVVVAVVAAIAGCSSSAGDGAAAPAGPDATTTTGPIPTTSAPPPPTVACDEVDPATWPASPAVPDFAERVGRGDAPHAPADPLVGEPTVTTPYPTVDDLVAATSTDRIDDAARAQALADAGYQGGVKAEWFDAEHFTSMQVLTFADAAGALAYEAQLRVPDICASPNATDVATLGDDAGITWEDDVKAVHGEFVVGSSAITLIRCVCGEPRAIEGMQAWHDTWVDELG